jgi:hypothetical protein
MSQENRVFIHTGVKIPESPRVSLVLPLNNTIIVFLSYVWGFVWFQEQKGKTLDINH